MFGVTTKFTWPVGLSYDIALNDSAVGGAIYTDAELCSQHHISLEKLEEIKNIPAFRQEVVECIKGIRSSNGTIKRKAVLQTEHWIDTIVPFIMSADLEDVSADTKLRYLQTLAKIGRIIDDPSEKARLEDSKPAQLPMININLSGMGVTAEVQAIEHESSPKSLN